VVFIKVEKTYKKEIDIKKLAKYIIDNVRETKQQVSKNIARFIPVEIATKAKFEDFEQFAPGLLDKYFPKGVDNKEKISVKYKYFY
jgi:hypothetical protein